MDLLALIPNVANPWVELTLENRLARGGCPRTYKHMIKLTFNQCGTLGSIEQVEPIKMEYVQLGDKTS